VKERRACSVCNASLLTVWNNKTCNRETALEGQVFYYPVPAAWQEGKLS
jgi:hypothetical protein